MKIFLTCVLVLAACTPPPQMGSQNTSAVPASAALTPCSNCAAWNIPHDPVQIYGNTYYVGTAALSAILVTSPRGHVLIDGALAESAPLIAANVEALGFRMKDIRFILNSHAHFDHSGGIAALQRNSGATVAASPRSAVTLKAGLPGPDDPQYADLLRFPMPAVMRVREIADGEVIRVGPVALTAHFTPGHTAGGTSWTWTSCEQARCLSIVYADSFSPVAEEGFRFSQSQRYPSILADFERSFAVVERLSCDILLSPHPGVVDMFGRLKSRAQGEKNALIDRAQCSRYVAAARSRLEQRLESERREIVR